MNHCYQLGWENKNEMMYWTTSKNGTSMWSSICFCIKIWSQETHCISSTSKEKRAGRSKTWKEISSASNNCSIRTATFGLPSQLRMKAQHSCVCHLQGRCLWYACTFSAKSRRFSVLKLHSRILLSLCREPLQFLSCTVTGAQNLMSYYGTPTEMSFLRWLLTSHWQIQLPVLKSHALQSWFPIHCLYICFSFSPLHAHLPHYPAGLPSRTPRDGMQSHELRQRFSKFLLSEENILLHSPIPISHQIKSYHELSTHPMRPLL